MKNQEKQVLKSTGVLAIIGSACLALSLIAIPWNRSINDNQSEVARRKAEVVGYQIVQIYREATRLSAVPSSRGSGRSPASVAGAEPDSLESIRTVGSMGQDPWGEPFHYRILAAAPAGPLKILVWSLGPNKKNETPKLDEEEAQLSEKPAYGGDDLGVLLSMSQN